MVKRSPCGNLIGVVMDVGGFGKPSLCSFDLMMRGLGWQIGIPILPQHPVLTNEDWTNTNMNVAEIVKHLESTFVPHIDAIYGRSPPWITDCGNVEYRD